MSYKKFTKDIGIIGLIQFTIAMKGLVVLPIITKLLGPENYGVWAQLIVTLSLVTPIATLGLPYALVRFLSAEKDNKKIQDGIWSVLTIIFGIAGIISLAIIIFSGQISKLLGIEAILLQIIALAMIFDCSNEVLFNVFRSFREMNRYSYFMIFQTLGETGLVVAAIIIGYGILGAVLSLLIIRVINFLAMGGYILCTVGLRMPKFSKTREYLHFGLPNVPGAISFWVVQSSDRYLIGFFLGTIFVGYYAPAYTLGNSIAMFVMPLAFVLPAFLCKYYDENGIKEVKTYLKYSLKYFLMVAIPSFFGLTVLSKQLLTFFTTPEIAEHSYCVVPFIALSMLSFGIYTISAQIIVLKKKTYITGTIWIIAGVLSFLLNLAFVPKFGILGAAITVFLTYALVSIAMCYKSFKELPFEIDWSFIVKSILASAIMSLSIFCINPANLSGTLAAVFMGIILYIILILLLNGIEKKEIDFLSKFFKR